MTTKHSLEELEKDGIELYAEFEVEWDRHGQPEHIYITKATEWMGDKEVELINWGKSIEKFLMEHAEAYVQDNPEEMPSERELAADHQEELELRRGEY